MPFGAMKLALTVSCSGKGKNEGGEYKFLTTNTPLSAPTQPLNMAATIYNVLEEAGRSYTAQLVLDFGQSGRLISPATFTAAADAAQDGVSISAEFLPQRSQGSLLA